MRYHDITKDDMRNGDGLRVVLWVAGCEHCCRDCHNPITWDPEGGLLFDEDAKKEIFAQLDQKYIAGLTFSGGDPLHPANRPAVRALARGVKERYRTRRSGSTRGRAGRTSGSSPSCVMWTSVWTANSKRRQRM